MNQRSDEIVILNFEEGMRLHRFNGLKDYLNVTEDYLKTAKNDFEKTENERERQLRNLYPNLTDDDISAILYDEIENYHSEYPRILRNSFFILVISLFEFEAIKKCKRLKNKHSQKMVEINSGSTLKKIKKYVKKAGYKFPSNQKWEEINNYY